MKDHRACSIFALRPFSGHHSKKSLNTITGPMKLVTLVKALLLLGVPFGFHVADAARKYQTDTKVEVRSGSQMQLIRGGHENQSISQITFELVLALAFSAEALCKANVVAVKVARAIAVCKDKGVGEACTKRICVISKCCKILQVLIKGGYALEKAIEAPEDTEERNEAESYLDANSFSVDEASALTPDMQDQLDAIMSAVQMDERLPDQFKAEWVERPAHPSQEGSEGLLQLGANLSQVHTDTKKQLEVSTTKTGMIDAGLIWIGFQVAEYWCKVVGKIAVKAAEIIMDCWERDYWKCFMRLCGLGNCCNLFKQSWKLFQESGKAFESSGLSLSNSFKRETAEQSAQDVDEDITAEEGGQHVAEDHAAEEEVDMFKVAADEFLQSVGEEDVEKIKSYVEKIRQMGPEAYTWLNENLYANSRSIEDLKNTSAADLL